MWKVAPGDIILHYSNQHIVAISTALTSATLAKNPFKGDDTWGQDGKQIAVDIHWLEVPIAKTDIPIEARIQGSADGGPFQRNGEKVKQGYFFRVSTNLWNVINNIAKAGIDVSVSDQITETLEIEGSTDVAVLINARKEQSQLRAKLLKGSTEAQCGICGRTVPARYLHAAHIKQRSQATERERRDPNIAMLACSLGCDQGFECGDIIVDSKGIISLRDPSSQFLTDQFGYLIGKRAAAFSEVNRTYFDHRRKQWTE